jgi:hypothetical protein
MRLYFYKIAYWTVVFDKFSSIKEVPRNYEKNSHLTFKFKNAARKMLEKHMQIHYSTIF